eukprot:7379544-Prymnesium_polylepis.2
MEGESRRALGIAVKLLKQEHLVFAHVGIVEPLVLRSVLHSQSVLLCAVVRTHPIPELAPCTVLQLLVDTDHLLLLDGRAVEQCQWIVVHRMTLGDVPPSIGQHVTNLHSLRNPSCSGQLLSALSPGEVGVHLGGVRAHLYGRPICLRLAHCWRLLLERIELCGVELGSLLAVPDLRREHEDSVRPKCLLDQTLHLLIVDTLKEASALVKVLTGEHAVVIHQSEAVRLQRESAGVL